MLTMTNDLLNKYVEALDEEEEAFWLYKHIFKEEPEKVHQVTILGIMEEEYNHFCKLVTILFPTTGEQHWTPMELAFHHVVHEKREAMRACLDKLKNVK
jgi:hypothetical protein